LVNDVLFHTGNIGSADFFHRIDSWENILSNKICVLSRDDAKDIADLVFLSLKYNFTWESAINNAHNKDTWVNEVEVSRLLYGFDIQRLTRLNWINTPEFDHLQEACKIIAKDIIEGGSNSIAGEL